MWTLRILKFKSIVSLLSHAHPGDILLVEQVDRLSRLTAEDWERLKLEMTSRRLRVVALELPTSWMVATDGGDKRKDRRRREQRAFQSAS